MCVDADKQKDGLIKEGLNETDGPVFKMKEDPRITKVGKFYRKWSIDELLQLINVINGSMSVVGPRPPIPREVEDYTEEQRQRLMVKGGLLCLWQIQRSGYVQPFLFGKLRGRIQSCRICKDPHAVGTGSRTDRRTGL